MSQHRKLADIFSWIMRAFNCADKAIGTVTPLQFDVEAHLSTYWLRSGFNPKLPVRRQNWSTQWGWVIEAPLELVC